MKKGISRVLLVLSLVAALLLAACGGNGGSSVASSAAPSATGSAGEAQSKPFDLTLKVGASPAPHAEILEQVIPVLAEQGITLEIINFDDYVMPNIALADGDIDANYFQHMPYLENFNTENDTDLVSAASIHFEPLGIYPGKTATLEELPDGAVIGLPNDTSNEARALFLLEAQGLITLKEGVGFDATPKDIEDNPHNLQFQELEAAQLPASLPDLDFAVINGNYAVGAGIDGTVLVTEEPESDSAQTYANIICVRSGDEARPEIQALVVALQAEEIRQFILETYNGNVLPVF